MSNWWEIDAPQVEVPKIRAGAYFRHSAQDRQEQSIPIQGGAVPLRGFRPRRH